MGLLPPIDETFPRFSHTKLMEEGGRVYLLPFICSLILYGFYPAVYSNKILGLLVLDSHSKNARQLCCALTNIYFKVVPSAAACV